MSLNAGWTKFDPRLLELQQTPFMVYKTVNKSEPADIELANMGKSDAKVAPEDGDEKVTGIAFWELFMFASPADMAIFWTGIFGTALAGATLPVSLTLACPAVDPAAPISPPSPSISSGGFQPKAMRQIEPPNPNPPLFPT